MKQIKQFFSRHSLAVIIIIAASFGLAGGLVGEIAARAYLADSLYGVSPFGPLDFSSGPYADQGLIISNPKNVIVQQDAKTSETIGSVGESLVGIYKKKKLVKSSRAFELDNFYNLNEPSGQGLIITSDGWIVTNLSLLKTYGDYAVIAKDKKIYQIDKAAADSLTGFNFLHIQGRSLPVMKFAESQTIKNGQAAAAVNWMGRSLVAAVAGFNRSAGLVKSSDSFSEKLALSGKLPPEFAGSAVFNLAGEALGLVDGRGEIEPISHFSGAIKSLFKDQILARPALGISYLDLAELAGAGGQNGHWQKGAIIYKNDKFSGVKKNSPADKAGLREGDIVIAVNDVYLDKNNDLADIIQDHLIGETVNLLISRNGEEKSVKVTLEGVK